MMLIPRGMRPAGSGHGRMLYLNGRSGRLEMTRAGPIWQRQLPASERSTAGVRGGGLRALGAGRGAPGLARLAVAVGRLWPAVAGPARGCACVFFLEKTFRGQNKTKQNPKNTMIISKIISEYLQHSKHLIKHRRI